MRVGISKLVFISVWMYLLIVSATWLSIYVAGDLWWPATILLFGPRWLLALPLIVFAPLVIWRRKFLLFIPLIAAAMIMLGPLMGLQLNKPAATAPQGQILRVLTYNVFEGQFNTQQFNHLLQDSVIDLAALQELPSDMPLNLPDGWQGIRQQRLAVYSRYPLQLVKLVQVQQPGVRWPNSYLLHAEVITPQGVLAFCSIHLPSPRYGLQSVLSKRTLIRPSQVHQINKQTKARWFAATEVQKYLGNITQPLLVVGDFNTPADSNLFRTVWGRYHNAFSETGLGYGWTQRVSVRGLPYGARIDHVLTTNGLQPLLCEVGPDMGSDHLPLIADVTVAK